MKYFLIGIIIGTLALGVYIQLTQNRVKSSESGVNNLFIIPKNIIITVYTPKDIYYLSKDSLKSETGEVMIKGNYLDLIDSLENYTADDVNNIPHSPNNYKN